MANDVLFDFEKWLRQLLGLIPSVQIEAKKPEPEKVEAPPEGKAAERVPTKEYPPYSPSGSTVGKDEFDRSGSRA